MLITILFVNQMQFVLHRLAPGSLKCRGQFYFSTDTSLVIRLFDLTATVLNHSGATRTYKETAHVGSHGAGIGG
jgi:hypothetical protein